jgi:hypothetical protein
MHFVSGLFKPKDSLAFVLRRSAFHEIGRLLVFFSTLNPPSMIVVNGKFKIDGKNHLYDLYMTW